MVMMDRDGKLKDLTEGGLEMLMVYGGRLGSKTSWKRSKFSCKADNQWSVLDDAWLTFYPPYLVGLDTVQIKIISGLSTPQSSCLHSKLNKPTKASSWTIFSRCMFHGINIPLKSGSLVSQIIRKRTIVLTRTKQLLQQVFHMSFALK